MTVAAETGRGSPRGRGRPANTSSEETAAVVLGAARRLFAAHGYAATSNRAVAAESGLAHTAVYNHFGSKALLFTAVFVDVQDVLIAELDRSVDATPDEPALPGALLDAIESLRAADPSYVEFLASMYVEVRRHPELQEIFRGGHPFPIVDMLRRLAGATASGAPDLQAASDGPGDDPLWFWIAFALGLAQLSALADTESFAQTVAGLRRQFAATPVASPNAPPRPNTRKRASR